MVLNIIFKCMLEIFIDDPFTLSYLIHQPPTKIKS